MNDNEKIEELLHYYRMEQKDFAEKCSILPETISNIKRGLHGISNKVFNKIITAFPEINKEWLRDGEGEMIINNQSVENVSGTGIVGNNVSGGGINDNSIVEGLMRTIERRDEQIDRLLSIIEQINNREI